MPNADRLKESNRKLEEQLTKLSEASLRISESLDVNTVLQEVVAGACALTGARMGGITMIDESGQLLDFVAHGLSAREHREVQNLPDGPEIWEYLKGVTQPLRLKNMSAHFKALGLAIHPVMDHGLLGVPIRHQGTQVGFFYLLDKESGQQSPSPDRRSRASHRRTGRRRAPGSGAAPDRRWRGNGPSRHAARSEGGRGSGLAA